MALPLIQNCNIYRDETRKSEAIQVGESLRNGVATRTRYGCMPV